MAISPTRAEPSVIESVASPLWAPMLVAPPISTFVVAWISVTASVAPLLLVSLPPSAVEAMSRLVAASIVTVPATSMEVVPAVVTVESETTTTTVTAASEVASVSLASASSSNAAVTPTLLAAEKLPPARTVLPSSVTVASGSSVSSVASTVLAMVVGVAAGIETSAVAETVTSPVASSVPPVRSTDTRGRATNSPVRYSSSEPMGRVSSTIRPSSSAAAVRVIVPASMVPDTAISSAIRLTAPVVVSVPSTTTRSVPSCPSTVRLAPPRSMLPEIVSTSPSVIRSASSSPRLMVMLPVGMAKRCSSKVGEPVELSFSWLVPLS